MVCGMIGDALGAPVEGWPAAVIRKRHNTVQTYLLGKPLGISEARRGMYTDDTNCALALAASVIRCQGRVDAQDCAEAQASFWKQHKPERGYPWSSQKTMQAILDGTPCTETGTLNFPDGSYANGSAMKIGPIAVFSQNQPASTVLHHVKEALLSTHVHPEAIDGANVLTQAIIHLLHTSPGTFDASAWLDHLLVVSETNAMKKRLSLLKKHCHSSMLPAIYVGLDDEKDGAHLETYGEMDFQIKAVVAVACALWAFLMHPDDPLAAYGEAIGLGGDTDTIATMLGYMIGAYHGCQWLPDHLWEGLESGEYGRDYCVNLSRQLTNLVPPAPTNM